MKLSFRWYGEDDKVTLENIRTIKIVDKKTKEVIKEFPPEKACLPPMPTS